ncbi:acyl-CoA dehydrogenase family protein [Bordetella tumulicola]|uniref:acyl-CoA dehydrogenase family protein n=1 Tax=Bordetella tumulicola TaxID=1649133 RepID=UPI0039EDE8DA
MNFDLNSEQIELQDQIRRFMRREVVPLIDESEAGRKFPFELFPKLAEFGYMGGVLPESEGGLGIDYVTWSMMFEQLGYHWLSLRTMLNCTNVPMFMLASRGTAEQKEKYLKPLIEGKASIFTAITEPNVGSNPAAVQTRAELKGDHYVISGRKLWISNGLWADFGIVVARTYSADSDGKLSLFIVDAKESPFERRAAETMVLRCTGTAELGFYDVKVPRENLLGAEGDAMRITLAGLDVGRLHIAHGAVGAAQAALDLATDFAKTREQFGKPIGSFQLVQKHIVDMTIRVNAARALSYQAACALQQGRATMECAIAKLYATEAAHEVASMALQVHGGQGYAVGYPIERIFRDTRGGTIPEGTTEIQTLIIGRSLLGMSAIH